MTYTVTVGSVTNASPTTGSVTFDIYNTRSEAVHVNLVGYVAATDHKAADLYAWLGNGGARDYTPFEGSTVYLYNVGTGQATPVGMVTFWKPSGSDVFFYNLTRSAVWNVDFPGFTSPGTYRLAVQGVGCGPASRSRTTSTGILSGSPSAASITCGSGRTTRPASLRPRARRSTSRARAPRTPSSISRRSPRTILPGRRSRATSGTTPTTGRPIASPATRPTPMRGAATLMPPTGTATPAISIIWTCCCPTLSNGKIGDDTADSRERQRHP